MKYKIKLLTSKSYLFLSICFIFFYTHLLGQEVNNDTISFKIEMPVPSGKYNIGTKTFSIVDSTRFDSTLNKNGRDVAFQMWYPSLSKSKTTSNYIPSMLADAMIKDEYNNIDSLTIRQWERLPIHASLSNPALQSKKFPVLFFLHGFGMSRYSYISIIEDLVSHGYIVISIDSPHSGLLVLLNGKAINTLYDGNPIAKCEEMAKDVTFVFDWLQKTKEKGLTDLINSIDFNKAGVLGHSLGGAAALETCRTDNRFAACIDLDGDPFGKVEQEGLNKPTLILLNAPLFKAERFKEEGSKAKWDSMGIERKQTWQNVLMKNEHTKSYAITISGTNHFTFTDFPFATIQYYRNPTAGVIINKNRGLLIISSYIQVFFNSSFTRNNLFEVKKMTDKFPETNIYVTTIK